MLNALVTVIPVFTIFVKAKNAGFSRIFKGFNEKQKHFP